MAIPDATSVSPSSNATLEPVVEPVASEEGAQLSLKVRTLDQKTYSITICAAASVPQLKELVAVETGVTLARQRLIYRGRVLKNDQTLASYSLEDGHVLHLVVRAVPSSSPPPPLVQTDAASIDDQRRETHRASDESTRSVHRVPTLASYLGPINEIDARNVQLGDAPRTTLRSTSRSRQLQHRARSPPPSPRDNDEPDPTMGRSSVVPPGRVLMGATIAVPEGTGVTMPFLSSLVANLITQVNENGTGIEAGGGAMGTTGDGQRHVTFSREVPDGNSAAEMDAATAQALRHHHRNRGGLGRQRTVRRSSSANERQAALRARIGIRLQAVRATLDDVSLQFPTQLTTLLQDNNNAAMSELQQQVEMLLTLLERFGPSLRLLPAALAQRDHLSERAAAAPTETATVSTGLLLVSGSNGSSTASAESTPVPTGVASVSIESSTASNTTSAGFSGASADPSTAAAEPSTASAEPSTASAEPSTASAEPSTASAYSSIVSSAFAGSNTAAAELVTASIGPNSTPAESSSGSTTASNDVVATGETLSERQIVCIIEALQTIGESTELLARVARHAFVRQSMQLDGPVPRRGNAAAAGDRIQARFYAAQAGVHAANSARASTTAGDRTQATLESMQATRTSGTVIPGVSNARPQMRVGHVNNTDLLNERSAAIPRTAIASSVGLPELTLSFPIDLASGTVPPISGPATSVPPTGTEAVSSDGIVALAPSGAQISISGMGLPLVSSVVFPFSLAAGLGGSHATTTWNLADFVSRLTSGIPISTLYGVMAGDATHLHHILAHIGFALFSGVDVPRVTRPSIHTWVQDLVAELRRLLSLNALPGDVMDLVNGTVERRLALGDELLRVVEPFIPDLVDFLVRATSASRAAAFGTSSATFLRTMAQQVVRELRSYATGDSSESEDESDERLKCLLRELLVWFGMNNHIAGFVVDSLLCWTGGDSTVSRRRRTRQRDEASSDADVADSPATKRQRE